MSSSCSSDSEDLITDEFIPEVRKSQTSETVGEGNLKGFVSAFQTIMNRTGGVDDELSLTTVAAKAAASVPLTRKRKTELAGEDVSVLKSHIREPRIRSQCEREIQFVETAHRGIVKLFKAVAMHKRRVIDHEKSLGIGVDKTGRRRRLRPSKDTAASTALPLTGTAGMNNFLDALKNQKSKKLSSTDNSH